MNLPKKGEHYRFVGRQPSVDIRIVDIGLDGRVHFRIKSEGSKRLFDAAPMSDFLTMLVHGMVVKEKGTE